MIFNFTNPYTANSNNNYEFVANTAQTITEVVEDIINTNSNASSLQDILQFIIDSVKLTGNSSVVTGVTVTAIISDLLKINTTTSNKVIILQTINDLIKVLNAIEVTNAGIYLQIITELLNIKDRNSIQVEVTTVVRELVSFLMQSFIFNANDVYAICSELIKFKDSIDILLSVNQIINVMINELFKFYSESYNYSEFTQYIVDQLYVNSKTILSSNFVIALSDTMKFTNSNINNVDINVYLQEILKMNFIINLNGQLYECYCINLENKALTRYDNYEFESFCQFQRQYYGIKRDGIFLLEGKTDGGEDIQSKVKTGYFNIANIQTKGQGFSSLRLSNSRLESGYAIVKNDGQIIFRIYNDKNESFDYSLNEVYDNEKFKFQIGQGLKGSAFQLELETTGNFELKDCAIVPVVLKRKI